MLFITLSLLWSNKVNLAVLGKESLWMTELLMTEADHENVERTTKCDHDFFESDVKVRDQFHVTAKYRVAAH